jgi:hypothetical protein
MIRLDWGSNPAASHYFFYGAFRALSLSEVQNWPLNHDWTCFDGFKVQNANLTTTIYSAKTCLRGKGRRLHVLAT